MRVTLLFFAAARDATGHTEIVVDLPAAIRTVGALFDWLSGEYPTLVPYLDCLRIARNEQFVDIDAEIAAGDVLAVIPPVAGG